MSKRLKGCQSTNHDTCYGELWQCSKCGKSVCCNEGMPDSDLCDSCWAERDPQDPGPDASDSDFDFSWWHDDAGPVTEDEEPEPIAPVAVGMLVYQWGLCLGVTAPSVVVAGYAMAAQMDDHWLRTQERIAGREMAQVGIDCEYCQNRHMLAGWREQQEESK